MVACLPRMEHRECCVSEAVREGLVAQEAAAAKAAQEAGGARGLGAHSALAARLSSSALQEGAEAAAAPGAVARCGRSACPVAGLAAGCSASTPAWASPAPSHRQTSSSKEKPSWFNQLFKSHARQRPQNKQETQEKQDPQQGCQGSSRWRSKPGKKKGLPERKAGQREKQGSSRWRS